MEADHGNHGPEERIGVVKLYIPGYPRQAVSHRIMESHGQYRPASAQKGGFLPTSGRTRLRSSRQGRKVKLVTVFEGDPKVPFSIASTPKCREGPTPFFVLLNLIIDMYLILLSVKQGDIRYHFLSLWYDSTWN